MKLHEIARSVVNVLSRRTRAIDHDIDALIAEKGAKPIVGMELTDRQKLERAGGRVWQETLRAQRRTQQGDAGKRRAS